MALFPLGTVHPTKDAWKSINLSSDFSGVVLAFQTFNGEGFDRVFSWVLVRRVWNLAGSKLHDKPSRVFPSENDLLLPLACPIISMLMDSVGSAAIPQLLPIIAILDSRMFWDYNYDILPGLKCRC